MIIAVTLALLCVLADSTQHAKYSPYFLSSIKCLWLAISGNTYVTHILHVYALVCHNDMLVSGVKLPE